MEPNRLFAYGILKRGFEADLLHMGGKFLYEAFIDGATLYRVGQNVSALVNTQDPARVVYGDLFEVPNKPHLWTYLDELEGVSRGLYRRIILPVTALEATHIGDMSIPDVAAWVYELAADVPNKHLITNGRFEYEFD